MTPEEVVRGELAAWNRLDVEGIMGFFAPDAVWDNGPLGVASGHDEIRKVVDGWMAVTTSMDVEILHLAATGPVVMIERIDHVVLEGRTIDARVVGVIETVGDQIAAWREYFDTSGHNDA